MKDSLFFIAIIPDEEKQKKVTELKEYIGEKFESRHALRSPPHITLHMPFKWREDKEKIMMETLSEFSKGKASFIVEMKGFNSFPPRVIYIDVSESKPLRDLQSDLVSIMKQKLNLFNANYKDRGFNPHMTIAHRDLKKPMFYQAWDYFKGKEIQFMIDVNSIFLLKHNGSYWDVYREFEFY